MHRHLNSEQRSTISVLLQQKIKKIDIAHTTGVSLSPITREISRNGEGGRYSFRKAEENVKFGKHSKIRKYIFTESTKSRVIELFTRQWSSEQIVGYCRTNNLAMVSTTMIYKYVYLDSSGG